MLRYVVLVLALLLIQLGPLNSAFSQAESSPAATAPAPAPTQPMMHGDGSSMGGVVATTRAFLRDLAAGVPMVPGELARARAVFAAGIGEGGIPRLLLLLTIFTLVGLAADWLFRRLVAVDVGARLTADGKTAREKLRDTGLVLLHALGRGLAFTLGGLGGFVALEWPPLVERTVAAYLGLACVLFLTAVVARLLLGPRPGSPRLLPLSDTAARFWCHTVLQLVGWFALADTTLGLLREIGLAPPARALIGLSFGAVLLALALVAVWRAPMPDGTARIGERYPARAWLLTIYCVALLASVFTGQIVTFYIGIVLLLLAISRWVVKRGVDRLIDESHLAERTVSAHFGALLVRGVRAVLVIIAAAVVADILGLDLAALATHDTLSMRLSRGVINALVIVLVADVAMHLSVAWIDAKLAEVGEEVAGTAEEARHKARLRTLLPVAKITVRVVLVLMAALMALQALGVDVGPLIAGAGVVGIAIGFGAQSLVKDILAGVFFLIDDAFRVGEYIESGNIRGTVESFSLRSMKLRHHRGALHTIPFGALDKITNYSRDWAIEKMSINVTYDTDLDQVKKIIREVGQRLREDPELAPSIIQPLKMQGVEQFGDFAVEIRLKMTTRPGEQFVVRRRAYALIKKAFDAKGIKFAFPTVNVASSGGDAATAAASKALELVKPAPAPPPAA